MFAVVSTRTGAIGGGVLDAGDFLTTIIDRVDSLTFERMRTTHGLANAEADDSWFKKPHGSPPSDQGAAGRRGQLVLPDGGLLMVRPTVCR
jgi:hypothetical protein